MSDILTQNVEQISTVNHSFFQVKEDWAVMWVRICGVQIQRGGRGGFRLIAYFSS